MAGLNRQETEALHRAMGLFDAIKRTVESDEPLTDTQRKSIATMANNGKIAVKSVWTMKGHYDK